MDEPDKVRRLRWSPEIRSGDVLNAITVVLAGFAAWQAMDRRVTKVEERQARATEVVNELRADLRSSLQEIKSDGKETAAAVRSLENRITRKGI